MRKTIRILVAALALGALGLAQEAKKARLLVADAQEAQVLVLEPDSGKVLARFSSPPVFNLHPLPDRQHVLGVSPEASRISFIFAGLRLESHGDHEDLKEEFPYVLATLNTGPQPRHVAVQPPYLAIFHEGDGSVAVFDLRKLGLDFSFDQVATGRKDHGTVALLGETLLVGGMESGRLEAYTLGGRKVLTLPQACPGLHGKAVLEETAAFGCADGVLLVQKRGNGLEGRKIPNPPGSPQGARVTVLTAHPKYPFFVGSFGRGLAFVQEGRMEVLPLPETPMRFFGFDPEGSALWVLTADGGFHKVDPVARQVVASLKAITPFVGAQHKPGFALGQDVVYLSDPVKGEVVEVDLKAFRIAKRIPVGGKPTALALVEAFGMMHGHGEDHGHEHGH